MVADHKSNKNGLVELFRFICAVWVAYFHGFFPIITDNFNGIVFAVEFFFMVSGFFFLKSMEKYKEKPFLEGVRYIVWGRTKKIIVPFAIAALSILLCNIIFEMDFTFNWPFSFLWFFAAQFLYLSLFYLIFKKTKKQSSFNIACVIIIIVFMSLFWIGRVPDRVLRGPAMIAIGVLVSQIPKLKIKSEKLSIVTKAICFAVCAIAIIFVAYLPGFAIWKLHLACGILYPLILYFATSLPVHSKFLNFLGELSVYIYLAQCPILIHYYAVGADTRAEFPLLCLCVVVLFAINRLANRKKAA